MSTEQRSPLNLYVFGEHVRNWLAMPREDWHTLALPDLLEDQVFRIMLTRSADAHYFEFLVSEQCPKDTYTLLARCASALGIQRLVVSVIHARCAGAHLIFWRSCNAGQFHHLDIDPAQPSSFEKEVIASLRQPSRRRMDRLFELIEGQSLNQTFFVVLRKHLTMVDCKQETTYYALVDLVLKLIFLIFVQRKGWLNFDPHYLESHMAACHGRGLSIVQCFFRPLFAQLEGDTQRVSPDLGNLPCLGGGLFSFRHELLPRLHNDWCLDLYRDLVSRYSFSLFEARAGRNVLGVCPEVLGHVFENLLLGNERKNQGTFYTPLHVAEKQVEASFQAWRNNNSFSEAEFRRRLPSLRVLDPSCGSGTYLVAAFGVLLRHRLDGSPKCNRYNGQLFKLKRSIMLENLFGVDIHPMAIRLAEVRLWLNMIQDLEIDEPKKAPALPNLQHHLRPGDFLGRHLPSSKRSIKRWPKYPKLEEIRALFPRSGHKQRSIVLRHIYRLENELVNWLDGQELEEQTACLKTELAQRILPGQETLVSKMMDVKAEKIPQRLHVIFSKVFLSGGFDLIVGNPPWLRASGMSRSQKSAIQADLNYPDGLVLTGQVDLSLYFVVASLSLLKPTGQLSFLLPGKVLQARYAAGLRSWVMQHGSLDFLFDYGVDHNLLFDADTFPVVVGISPKPARPNHQVLVERHSKGKTHCFTMPQESLGMKGGAWTTEPPKKVSSMQGWPKLSDSGLRIRRGVVTNAKRIFTFTNKPQLPMGVRVRPLLRGRDISVQGAQPGAWIYWPFDLGPQWYEQLPRPEQSWLIGTGQLQRRGALHQLRYRPHTIGSWVLIWKYLASSWQVALLKSGDWVPDQTTYFINFKTFELAYRYYTWFSSKLASQWLGAVAERGKGHCFFYYAHTVGTLPVPPDLKSRHLEIPVEREQKPGEGRATWTTE